MTVCRFASRQTLNKSPLEPFLALVPQLKGMEIGGTGTGRVEFGGFERGERMHGSRVCTLNADRHGAIQPARRC